MSAADDSAGRVVPIGGGDDEDPSGQGEEADVDVSPAALVKLVRGIPAFARLLFRLLGDPRVSLFDRVLFGGALVYLFTPIDVIPDWFVGVGQLDDLLLVLVALDRLLIGTPEDILSEHWDGDDASLWLVRDLLDSGARRLPGWARRLVRSG